VTYNNADEVLKAKNIVLKNELEKEVLDLIIEDPNYRVEEIADILDINRVTVNKKMKYLKQKNLIKRVGSCRNGYWVIPE